MSQRTLLGRSCPRSAQRPMIRVEKIKPIKNPPVGAIIAPFSHIGSNFPPAPKGAPRQTRITYKIVDAVPVLDPARAPLSSTANVCIVTGIR